MHIEVHFAIRDQDRTFAGAATCCIQSRLGKVWGFPRQKEAGQKELTEINRLREFRARLAEAKLLTLQGVNALQDQQRDDALGFFKKRFRKVPSSRPATNDT